MNANPYGSPPPLKPHQNTLTVAALVSLLLWVVPFFGLVLLPLQYLNTHLHEFCHALAAVATGGQVDYIHVFGSGGGVTLGSGNPYAVDPAGYLGATIIGALMILSSRTERGAAITLRTVGVVLSLSLLLWVRGDLVGIVSGLAWIACLFALPVKVKGRNLVFVAQLLGIQQCLSSIQSLYILFRISAFGGAQSDAAIMAQDTGIPALFWAVLWGLIGLGALYATLRVAWSTHPAS